MLKEFKEFALRGSVVDLAVGIVIGSAFTSIVNSLVSDILMPPIGLLLGNADFSDFFVLLKAGETPPPYLTLADAQAAGAVTFNYGQFLNTIIGFIIIAFALFLLIRSINRLKRKEKKPTEEPTTKECPHCFTTIPIKATRCPNCTSELATA